MEIVNNVTYKHRVAGDSNTKKIDRAYDKIDGVIDLVGSVFGRTSNAERREIATAPAPVIEARAPKQLGTVSGSGGSGFRIIEAIDAVSGVETFTVTNGVAKAECASRKDAEAILKAMEAAPR